MKYGFVKVAAVTPKIIVANCIYNREEIIKLIESARNEMVDILVFPELSLTGYTCGDLFLQDALINSAYDQLINIIKYTEGMDMLIVLGLPFEKGSKLYNVSALIQNGQLLGIVPKKHLANHGDMNESRYFHPANTKAEILTIKGFKVPFGTNILFKCRNLKNLVISMEIGEDLWSSLPPSIKHTQAGATLILNPSASPATIGKAPYIRDLIRIQSAKLICGYIQADAGEGESTTDIVFSGHNIIGENGIILEESNFKYNQLLISEIDIDKLNFERRRNSIYKITGQEDYTIVDFQFNTKSEPTKLTRRIEPEPFMPILKEEREQRFEEVLNIQAHGLKKRLDHINTVYSVIGLSGGLDSTLALLVAIKAYKLLGIDPATIICVTMPCFGTTDRTYNNALALAKHSGATLREIPIKDAVIQHFKDIGHDIGNHDITYENAQARERTQVLMDVANQCGGIVIGTGDMSELVLGWATYNGDHMSMYGANLSIPKTMVKVLVKYYADNTGNSQFKEVLYDILDTPVSPELLPPVDGMIAQKTEDIVGPYELHDFFLYYALRYGFMPSKIYYLATIAFRDKYKNNTIYKWLVDFYRRFFSQQFKRSCLPDGPKVGSISVSPRSDLKMPSDASKEVWIADLAAIKP